MEIIDLYFLDSNSAMSVELEVEASAWIIKKGETIKEVEVKDKSFILESRCEKLFF